MSWGTVLWWSIILAVANAAIVKTLYEGSIFERPKDWLASKSERGGWLAHMILEWWGCAYCISHWTAAVLCAWVVYFKAFPWWSFPVMLLIVIRISNLDL